MKPPVKVSRRLDEEKFFRAAEAKQIELTVFLAGPYIDPTKRPGRAKKHIAARLRYHLHGTMTDKGHTVTLGEYEKLYDAQAELLGDLNDAAFSEIGHSRDFADAIVMLPSSPGSFSELGAFALYGEICEKMLVIIDSQYEEHKNYMNLGPVIGAKNIGAEVAFINYENLEECSKSVEEFLTQRLYRKATKRYLPR